MVYVLLVVAAWGSLFVPLPQWMKVLLGVGFLGLGSLLLMFGLAGSYWDSHMTSGTSAATSTLVTGVLLVLSRAGLLLKVVVETFLSPPST